MPLNRLCATFLLAIAMSLALPAAHARKDDDDKGPREQREQRYEPRGERANGNGRSRVQSEERRQRAPEAGRYEQRGQRPVPAYTQPRRRIEPRRDEPARYDMPDYVPRPDARPQSGYAPRGMSLSEAVSQAERRTGGRVLSAEPGSDGGRAYYRIKVLSPNGRVQILYIDAN